MRSRALRLQALGLLLGLGLLPAPREGFCETQVRRRLLLAAPLLLAADGRPARAQEGPELRRAQYRGQAGAVREGAEWYRFRVGDLVRRASGETAEDGLKVTDEACGVGLCMAGKALSDLERTVSGGGSRQGGLSQVERALITPMFLMVGGDVWDPDSNYIEEGRKKIDAFQKTITEMGNMLKDKKDPVVASKLYRRSLEQLNAFFGLANEAGAAGTQDVEYLPQLPLNDDELEKSEYWIAERQVFDELNDPVRVFSERNAFGSRELRYNLKRFPGATLLLR
ncbi:unnamed protein product [Effrenium voratum]|uniref:Uncharacterized protein n=1 Tax=Effrenium voratum TaxID=2562239 RepID=A0AA36IYT9_9DINO|nr:unnamed protein product [Effrenium voratum]CAJ1441720.1 unnamed protein product [Effrenium voratum]